MTRLAISMAAFVVLGAVAWMALSDHRLRLMTLTILAMFAVKTWVRWKAEKPPGDERDAGQ